MMRSRLITILCSAASIALLSGCAGFDTSVGPSKGRIAKIERDDATMQGVRVIDVTSQVAQQIRAQEIHPSFANDLPQALPVNQRIGKGDVLSIVIWEAPPAALFGSASLGGAAQGTSNATPLPEMQVGAAGTISVPYAGTIRAEGRTPSEIERDIVRRLSGKAHLPQVTVRLAQNEASQVTVVGEVGANSLFPLTPKGERVLDAIARAGGTKQPVDKMMIQLTRGQQVESMPLSEIIADPRQNITLQAGDIVTAIFQPFSFTALGATGSNQEVNFEARGITLSQALGRVAGLQDRRADPKGVFLFRWADPRTVPGGAQNAAQDAQGRIPVIYRIDMKNPATYFAIQNFTMQNRDVLYVSNSPVAEFQRFFSIVASTVLPVMAVERAM